MACCEFGEMHMTVEGQNYSARGEFTIRPTTRERDGGSNEDGSIWSTVKRVPAEAEGSLDACGIDLEDLWKNCSVTVTFHLNNGDIYTFRNSRIMGRPELNTGTGEVSGFKIMSAEVIKTSIG